MASTKQGRKSYHISTTYFSQKKMLPFSKHSAQMRLSTNPIIVSMTLLLFCSLLYITRGAQIDQHIFKSFNSVHHGSLSAPMDISVKKPHILIPLSYEPLPLGSLKPAEGSWLAHELQYSASGLAGHLWDFYTFVRNSSWVRTDGDPNLGEYSGLHESFGYWFNGLVHLAYSLPVDDSETSRLKSQVHDAADCVLNMQAADGWIGPETLESGQRLLWGRFPFLLGLTGLADANLTWESRAVSAVWNFTFLMHGMLKAGGKGLVHQGDSDPVFEGDYNWGRVRVSDMMLTLQWLLEKHPGSQKDSDAAWECMELLYSYSLKWEAWYNNATYVRVELWPGYLDLP